MLTVFAIVYVHCIRVVAESNDTDAGFGDFVAFDKPAVQASSGSLRSNPYV